MGKPFLRNQAKSHMKDVLEDYLEGDLLIEEERIVQEHLSVCSSCAAALEDAQTARGCLALLRSNEAPPRPGPEFFVKVQQSIERQQSPGWFGSLSAALHAPKFAYPLLFLFLGLLATAWTMTSDSEWADTGVFGIPQPVYSAAASVDRDLVMTSLVETAESEQIEPQEIPYFPETPDE